jgi:CheY-like chemotaxis protein
MPELDGLEATRRIRRQPGAQPKVVALTANAMPSDRAACMDAGMDDYMAKPIRLEDLAELLNRLFPTGAQSRGREQSTASGADTG